MKRALPILLLALTACGGGSPEPATPASNAPPSVPPSMAAGSSSPPPGDAPANGASAPEVNRAIAAIKANDFKSAKAALEQALHANPKNGTAAYYLGVALEGLGDEQGAEQRYKDAMMLAPDVVEASINLGALYLDANRYDDAIAVTKSGLAKRADDPALHANMAMALRGKGDKEGAAAEYAKAVKVVGDNAQLRLQYGSLLLELGKKPEAAAELKGALANAGSDRALLASIGRLLGPAGAFAECITAFDKAIAAGDAAELHVSRGLCRHSLKDETGAKADFEAAIKLDPKFPPAHYYLGQALIALGKNADAAKELDEAAKLAPTSPLGKKAKDEAAAARKGAKKKR